MKLSARTVSLIRNFSAINGNLLLTQGNVLSTKSSKVTIVASATVEETFPIEFGIYDANEFLGSMMLFDSPVLDFTDKYVTITEENEPSKKIKYYKAEKGVLIYHDKPIPSVEYDVEFNLSASLLHNVLKSSGVLKAEVVSIIGKDGQLIVQVGKQKVESNSFQYTVGTTDKTFKANILVEHFKMLPGDYVVSLKQNISRFTSANSDLVYFLAVESGSEF